MRGEFASENATLRPVVPKMTWGPHSSAPFCGSGGYRFKPGWSPFAGALFAHRSTMGGAASSGEPPFEDLASGGEPRPLDRCPPRRFRALPGSEPSGPGRSGSSPSCSAGTSPSCSSIKSRSNIRLNDGCFPHGSAAPGCRGSGRSGPWSERRRSERGGPLGASRRTAPPRYWSGNVRSRYSCVESALPRGRA